MKKIRLSKPPRFLTHHVLLRPDCLARLKLPAYLTQNDADRIYALLNALVMDPVEEEKDNWPYEVDLDGDLNALDLDDDFPDADDDIDMSDLEEDDDDDDDDEEDESGSSIGNFDDQIR